MDNTVNSNSSVGNFYKNIDRIKNGETMSEAAKFPLKWHKFLIYFGLWIGAISNLISGGLVFVTLSELMSRSGYFWYPRISLTGVAIYGIISVLLGIYGIVIRFRLANFRENAPQHLVALYVLGSLLPFIVDKCFDLGMGNNLGMIVGGILGALINSKYYGKRSSLFIC